MGQAHKTSPTGARFDAKSPSVIWRMNCGDFQVDMRSLSLAPLPLPQLLGFLFFTMPPQNLGNQLCSGVDAVPSLWWRRNDGRSVGSIRNKIDRNFSARSNLRRRLQSSWQEDRRRWQTPRAVRDVKKVWTCQLRLASRSTSLTDTSQERRPTNCRWCMLSGPVYEPSNKSYFITM